MLYKNRRKTKLFRLKIAFLSLISLTIAAVIFCEASLSDFTPEYIRIRAEALSTKTVCTAVEDTLKKLKYSYDDIARITYSDDGKIQSVTTDSFKINSIKSDVTKAVQKEMEKLYDNQIGIPIGAFTNITMLSNVGPEITVNFNLTGSFSSEIVSTLEQAGINQTIHHIKLILTSKIMTTSLDYSGSIKFTSDFEIAQSVIVGEIPSSYGSLYRAY